MRRSLPCLLLLALSAAGARPLGPQVDLVGPAIPLREALDRIGRQLNRRLEPDHAQDPRLTTTSAYNLQHATTAEALAALEDASGSRLRRQGRQQYALPTARSQPRRCLGRPLGEGWTVWLEELRAHFGASVNGAGERGLSVSGSLTPTLTIATPSDAECLRLVECSYPRATTDDGGTLEVRGGQPLRWPARDEGLLWLLQPYLPPPARAARRLKSLRCEVVRRELTTSSFSFDLPGANGPQLQTDGPVDATLTGDAQRGWSLALRLQGFEPDPQVQNERELGLEAQLHGADGVGWYTHSWFSGRTQAGPLLTFTWTIRSAEQQLRGTPVRLEVQFYRPTGRRETLPVEFTEVALPRLDP